MLIVYTTLPDTQTAEQMAETLVSEGIVACANIIPAMTAIYKWQGQVEKATECVLLLKTKADAFKAVEVRVRALHPYDLPAIFSLRVADVHQPYLDWIISGVTV